MKKIMFSDKFGLTEAVLSGRKTQTRRIVPQKDLDKACEFAIAYFNETFDVFTDDKEVLQHYFFVEEIGKLPYKVGEVVAVAQSYKDAGIEPTRRIMQRVKGFELFPSYANVEIQYVAGWNNKLFVAPMLMPHQIRITNVRVERLQDISYEDCLAEGVYILDEDPMNPQAYIYAFPNSPEVYYHPCEAYAALIDRISGKGAWQSNPYVLVDEFELIK